jgi:maltose alpha-D-glucosyltransferase/alpha-amylase
MRRPASATDPLWYQDAVIYELHVRAFADGNNDGVGDFPGLSQKLDYLQDLGVTCLWLLPFFPSPLKDDGYDISDYLNVHPSYGTLDDFQAFLNAAHDRDLQVMIELVMNHTSDQHPWFQAARNAPSGSVERDYYVWSDTDDKYRDARIIFTDTEKSNWTWDPIAKAYFWHRFFSHQPDLNYDNPRVVEEMLKVLRFWLDMGVDALRVDAIPYLFERDGTSCENLPETHVLVKKFRAEMDRDYANRAMLAEANQWPSDVRPYFGDGDECNMAFHFPLMPRMYMALRQEDRMPITDIMAQTPAIPANCQWALFLRNHDELTLEMVTSDERDYMYLAYSADPRMRINLGIRRRLAPLVDNNRRRVELLNSLLLSFPGTPIVYYGDEIGMGDNIYLGDRNGVRTPMQWNGDRNAGFSRANPAKLFSPVIMDPVWGYQAVNVEAQQGDPSSLLSWMRNMIALRKLFRVFGRGTLEFLNPENRKVLAYLRRYEGEQVLCIANLSRFAQPVDLDLSKLEGAVPVEMLGYVEFPPITRQPYRFTLGAYGFLWLELHGTRESEEAQIAPAPASITVGAGWATLFEGAAHHRFETIALPEFLPKQRWFSGKTRRIRSTHIVDWTGVEPTEVNKPKAALALIEVQYDSGAPETYFLPLAVTLDAAAGPIRENSPNAVIAAVQTPDGPGVLHDGILDDEACVAILSLIHDHRELPTRHGRLLGEPTEIFHAAVNGALPVRRVSAEQSNSSIIYGDRLILKFFRRFQTGPNPDCEIEKYLTERVHFPGVPPYAGALQYVNGDPEPATLGMLEALVENEGDAWRWTVDEIDRYYELSEPVEFPADAASELSAPFSDQPPSALARDHIGLYLEAAATLGRRTGELHRALGEPTADPAFVPEPFTTQDAQNMYGDLRSRAARVFDELKDNLSRLPDESVEDAARLLARRREILDRLRAPSADSSLGQRIRIHGDYHLGQVLRSKTDFVILDFEGEPARPLRERRAKQSALKDVAGMLRSFSYAAYSGLLNFTARRAVSLDRLEPWARLWERSASVEFLRGYREAAAGADFLPADPLDFRRLLNAFRIDKALYEVSYELNNRPTWVRIPLMGMMSGILSS